MDHDNPDEWELVNDDGFVYKRPHLDPAATSSSPPPPPDPALERKYRRERKKRALLKLRDRYLREIRQWELLSKTLKDMENSNAQTQPVEREEPTSSCANPTSSGEHLGSNATYRMLVDDLLCQVEAQEAIIRDVSNLCDVAESLCSAQEVRLKQQFTDLPVWEPSPNELMAALCDR